MKGNELHTCILTTLNLTSNLSLKDNCYIPFELLLQCHPQPPWCIPDFECTHHTGQAPVDVTWRGWCHSSWFQVERRDSDWSLRRLRPQCVADIYVWHEKARSWIKDIRSSQPRRQEGWYLNSRSKTAWIDPPRLFSIGRTARSLSHWLRACMRVMWGKDICNGCEKVACRARVLPERQFQTARKAWDHTQGKP